MSCIGLFLAISLHVGLEAEYNQVHPHARCTVENSIAGVYYNSEDNFSAYIGKQIQINSGFLEIGLVNGYTTSKVVPMIRYKKHNFFISPAYEKYQGQENIGLVLGLEFGK